MPVIRDDIEDETLSQSLQQFLTAQLLDTLLGETATDR
jgi:hypothetical protein